MRKIGFIGLLLSIMMGCNKGTESLDQLYIAEVVGYDLNCSTCLLYFPYALEEAKASLGGSESNFYNSVNLNQTDFQIGEWIQVKARTAKDDELRSCITRFPTPHYANIYVSESAPFQNSNAIDTIELKYGECITTFGQSSVCFDSVLNDSRCPDGAMCVWEGNACIKLSVNLNGIGEHTIELNTHKSFTVDTIIHHMIISLIGLTPHPAINTTINPNDYKARLSIVNRSTLKSNAQMYGLQAPFLLSTDDTNLHE